MHIYGVILKVIIAKLMFFGYFQFAETNTKEKKKKKDKSVAKIL